MIARHDAAALRTAEEMLVDTKSACESLIAESAASCAEERRRGFEQGLDEACRAQAELIAALAARHAGLLEEIERDLLELTAAAVREICGNCQDQSRIAWVIEKMLKSFRDSRQLVLRVNPEELSYATAQMEMLRGAKRCAESVSIEADPSVAIGDCVVTGDFGTVEFRLTEQLQLLRSTFGRRAQEPTASF